LYRNYLQYIHQVEQSYRINNPNAKITAEIVQAYEAVEDKNFEPLFHIYAALSPLTRTLIQIESLVHYTYYPFGFDINIIQSKDLINNCIAAIHLKTKPSK
jgi:hypothetical protein